MTVTVRKAGEAVAKTAKTKLRAGARAVTKAEASKIEPARASATGSLTPWKDWFQRVVKDNLSPERYQTFREWTAFMPDDIYDLQQSPKPSQKIVISKTDPSQTAMYRYPSPGSQKPAHQPEFEETEDPYDTGYFKKDTRRRYLSSELGDPAVEAQKLALMDPNDPAVQEEKERLAAGPESSKGNNSVFATGPSNFDPSGLRATMAVSWDSLNQSLDEHMPDHLPTPVWDGQEQEIIQWHQERDLPVPVGAYYQALKVPRDMRVARW